MFCGILFGLFRLIRYSLLLLWTEEQALSHFSLLAWNLSYIMPTSAILIALNIAATHWSVIHISIDWSDGFKTITERRTMTLRVLAKAFALNFWIHVFVNTVYALKATSVKDLAPDFFSICVRTVIPVIVGVSCAIAGYVAKKFGQKIGVILENSPQTHVSTERMSRLVTRIGRNALICGSVAILGGLATALSEDESVAKFVVKSVLFRCAECAGIVTVVSLYKLPSATLNESLDKLKQEKQRAREKKLAQAEINNFGRRTSRMPNAIRRGSLTTLKSPHMGARRLSVASQSSQKTTPEFSNAVLQNTSAMRAKGRSPSTIAREDTMVRKASVTSKTYVQTHAVTNSITLDDSNRRFSIAMVASDPELPTVEPDAMPGDGNAVLPGTS